MRSRMTEWASLLSLALLLAVSSFGLTAPDKGNTVVVGALLDDLPPTAAGPIFSNQLPGGGGPVLRAESPDKAASSEVPPAEIGGSQAVGRVSQVFVRVEQGVFIAWDRAPEIVRRNGEVYAELRFPELLANGAESALAYIGRGETDLNVGDVAEIRFARKNVRAIGVVPAFPVREVTRMTELAARNGSPAAREIERRILARTQGDRNQHLASILQTRLSAPAIIPGITSN